MTIEQIINKNAEKYSPYVSGLVNHLPMGQFALFNLSGDINRVEEYTKNYLNRANMDKVKENYKKLDSLEECLEKRDLYEACLDLIREMSKEKDIEELTRSILNQYPLGLSSGLFHTIIRLSYAIEGYKLDKKLKAEVERALAYYVTAYREGDIFKSKIPKEDVLLEMNNLIEEEALKAIRFSDISLGQKLQKIYGSDEILNQGFTIEGNEEDKVKAILKVLLPAFYNTNNIVMLHCITGLQAVVTLKDYFKDYNYVLDVFTSQAIAHLLTQKDLAIKGENTKLDESWDEVMKKASKSENVHTIKLAYSSKKLDGLFDEEDLKYIANKRVSLE